MKIISILFITIMAMSCISESNRNISVKAEKMENKDTSALKFDYDLDYMLGKFDPAIHEDFTEIDSVYADIKGRYLHKETYKAFVEMFEAAKTDGIHLKIRSAARNFDYQKGIWERKWNGETLVGGKDLSVSIEDPQTRALKILEYSSMPGSSRHHWGTDIDLNNFENEWFESGEGLVLFQWLEANASNFGFCRPYTAKGVERQTGYNEEKWHWSYMPLSRPMTQFAKEHLKDEMIKGFDGDQTTEGIKIVENYVLGINKDCK